MKEQISSILRSILKLGGGYLIAKGLTDQSNSEVIIAGILAAGGVVWSWWTHRNAAATPG